MHKYTFQKDGTTFKFNVCDKDDEFVDVEAWKDGVDMLDRNNNPDLGSRLEVAGAIHHWWSTVRLESMGRD